MRFRGAYWFLSNMYPCKIQWECLTFPCAESAYQAAKSIHFEYRRSFVHLNGFEAKKKGRQMPVRQDWNEIKIPIMKEILKIKFSDPVLFEELLHVKEDIIENNHWHDNFWGQCTCQECSSVKGQNNLGKLLMEIRDQCHNSTPNLVSS